MDDDTSSFFHAAPTPTCGKDDVPGNQFVVDDGELRELDPRHPRHGGVSSFPVELDVVRGVSICEGHGGGKDQAQVPLRASSPAWTNLTLLEIWQEAAHSGRIHSEESDRCERRSSCKSQGAGATAEPAEESATVSARTVREVVEAAGRREQRRAVELSACTGRSSGLLQHLNKSKAIQLRGVGGGMKAPAALAPWTHSSRSPTCSSARPGGTSSGPSCRRRWS